MEEVDSLIENVSWLKDRMPNYLNNWQSSRPNCNYNYGLIREICYKPGILVPQIFNPLLEWLNDYKANRQGKLAFPGPVGVDNFLKIGLRRIYNFIIVADWFSENPQFYSPGPSPTGNLAAYNESRKTQKMFSEIVNLLSSKLIGCNKQLSFLFLDLSKTVKGLPEDLLKMQTYLEDYCRTLKVKELRK